MIDKRLLAFAAATGEVMLSNGGETYRVEDTIGRILKCYPVGAETFVTPTAIIVSMEIEDGRVYTVHKRIRKRTYHLGKVALINDLSRQFVEGKLTLDESLQKLREIKAVPSLPLHVRIIAAGTACGSFSFILGVHWPGWAVAFLIGILTYPVTSFLAGKKISSFLPNIAGGGMVAVLTLAAFFVLPELTGFFDKIMIACIMPLVPGVTFTNAIRDIIEGDFISGSAYMLEALLVALAIAAGVGFVIATWAAYMGGIPY